MEPGFVRHKPLNHTRTLERVLPASQHSHQLEELTLLLIGRHQLGHGLATQLCQVLCNTTQCLQECVCTRVDNQHKAKQCSTFMYAVLIERSHKQRPDTLFAEGSMQRHA